MNEQFEKETFVNHIKYSSEWFFTLKWNNYFEYIGFNSLRDEKCFEGFDCECAVTKLSDNLIMLMESSSEMNSNSTFWMGNALNSIFDVFRILYLFWYHFL